MPISDDIVAVFRKCDVDKTGVISSNALRQLLRMLNEPVWTDEKISYLIGASGLESGGGLRYEEFFAWLFTSEGAARMERVAGEQARAPEVTAARSLPLAAAPPPKQALAPEVTGARSLPLAAAPPPTLDDSSPFAAILQSSAPAGRAEEVARLLREQPQVASSPDAQGRLPLHLALHTGQPLEVSTLLLQAHPEGAKVQDPFGSLPLHLALSGDGSSNGSVADLLRLYPEGASVKDQATGMLPVHLALMQCGPAPAQLASVLRQLLEVYPEASMAKAPSGDRPIQLAVYLDRGSDTFEELLKAAWKTQVPK